jgi:hypothetical protein
MLKILGFSLDQPFQTASELDFAHDNVCLRYLGEQKLSKPVRLFEYRRHLKTFEKSPPLLELTGKLPQT